MTVGDRSSKLEPLPDLTEELEHQIEAAAAILLAHDTFLVTAHYSPDGDAIGSTLALTLALRGLGKTVTAFNRNDIPYNLSFLPGSADVIHDVSAIDPEVEVVVVLDCCALDRVHPDLKINTARTRVICIDHHETVDEPFADVFVHDTGAAAVGEILVRLLAYLNCDLTADIAQCLFTSIQTDTGSFRYSNTTPAALAAAGQLVRAGVDVWKVSSAVYENHPAGRVQLLAEVLKTLTLASNGRLAFLTVSNDMYTRTNTGPDMLDGFINFARGIDGVEVAAQLRQVDNGQYRVSFRSRGRVNVARVAEKFGGGGHRNAAGCSLDGTADEVIEKVTDEIERLLEPFDESP